MLHNPYDDTALQDKVDNVSDDLGDKGAGNDAITRVQKVIDDLANATNGLAAIKTAVGTRAAPSDITTAHTTTDGKVDGVNTEVEAISLDATQGSVANKARLGLLTRWIADILNNATNGLANIVTLITAVKTATDKLAGADTGATHDVTTANDTVETQVFEIAKTIRYGVSVYVDLNALVVASEGGVVTLRLYNKIDETTYREIAQVSFIVGSDTTHPSFEVSMINHNVKMTIQCSNDVTATRTINYRYITEDKE